MTFPSVAWLETLEGVRLDRPWEEMPPRAVPRVLELVGEEGVQQQLSSDPCLALEEEM